MNIHLIGDLIPNIVTLIFITLRLNDKIKWWPWYMILLPTLISITFLVGDFIILPVLLIPN